MPLSPRELLFAGALAATAIVVILLLAFLRGHRARPSAPAIRGPNDLNYICAKCQRRFPHSRRTVAAWSKGTRRFFCNSCHRSWREAQPPRTGDEGSPPDRPLGSSESSSGAFTPTSRHAYAKPAKSGCLGIVLVALLLPPALYVLARYA